MKRLLTLFSLLFCINSFAIYQDDNRKDLYKISNPKIKLAASAIAYEIEKDELLGWVFNPLWNLVMKPLHERGVCQKERFSDQLSLRANCTGVLVSPKHLITAGNCTTEHYCKNDLYYWVFDYNLKAPGLFNHMHPKSNFYKCEKIIKRVYHPDTATSFALMELDKVVKGVTPLKVRQLGSMAESEKVIVLGHVQGLPLKIDDEVQVYDQNETHFLINSDISGSSLGSAILNAESFELEGLMIYGTPSFERSIDTCKTTPQFQNDEAQELGLKSIVFKELLSELMAP